MDDRHAESMSALELWKAHLAYVSGTILAWGAVLLQLWPVLTRLQTGTHVLAFGRDEGGAAPATSYYLLALLVAVGVGMLIFGAAHVLARGFWLARFLIPGPDGATAPASDRVARATYLVLHVFWATALVFLCLVPLVGLSALLAAVFTTSWRWPIAAGRVVASLIVFVIPAATVIALARRRATAGGRRLLSVAPRVGYRSITLAYASLLVLWLLVLEFSYVADVRLERHVFSRAADPTVVVTVELGGAVSDPTPARLALGRVTSDGRAFDLLPLRHVHDGVYVATRSTRSLPEGEYDITMTYPHGAMSPVFPFFRNRIHRRVGFVVVE